MGLQRVLDLFGIDLLAPAVDARRATAQEIDRAVLLDGGQVAGERPSPALGLDERPRRLLGVVVVADRDAPGLGQAPDLARSGLHPLERIVEHGVGLVDGEAPALRGPALVAGLRGAEAVEDHHVGQQLPELLLDGRRERRPAGADTEERRCVPAPGVGGEGVGERTGHGVADDRHAVDLLALDQVPRVLGVHPRAVEQHRPLGLEQCAPGDPLAGAVHERWDDQEGPLGGRTGILGKLIGRLHRIERVPAAAEHGEEGVVVAPHHALGHPRGAARVDDVAIVVGPGPEVALGGRGGQSRLVLVADLERGTVERRVELGAVHEGDQVGVLEEVAELVFDVAEVHVHGRRPQLHGGDVRLHPLGAVVGVDADVAARADALLGQVVGQAVGPLLELSVGQPPLAGHQALAVGDGVGHQLEQVGHVPGHGLSEPAGSASRRAARTPSRSQSPGPR